LARILNRLSARKVETETRIGRHADGGGLYLSISANGGKRWVFLFKRYGRTREMGLGSVTSVKLARARDLASDARQIVARGGDPILERPNPEAGLPFEECATRYIAANKPGWKNAKHADQWTNTLKKYAYPVIGRLPAGEVTTDHVIKILTPIWSTKSETASRVRSRIELVLDWAKVHGHRQGENPARWRGHLDQILPKRSKVRRVVHHPALPFAELPAFMEALRSRRGISARALEFTILTAARTSETIGATGAEMNTGTAIWTVPPDRMKAGREHRVPLASRAVAILTDLAKVAKPEPGGWVFPGDSEDGSLSNNAMLALLDRMKFSHVTVHGFRSSFRDWASETTAFPHEVVEMALAHTIENKAEAAYRRGDLFEKRRQLMTAWAEFCEGAGNG
jgi:integrase